MKKDESKDTKARADVLHETSNPYLAFRGENWNVREWKEKSDRI